MSLRCKILGSSSAGNAALLQTVSTNVLIDAGFSARRLNTLLASHALSLDRIDAIFITHEHADHIAGLKGIVGRHDIPIFANEKTAQVIAKKLQKTANWHLFDTGVTFAFRDLHVSSFTIPHDAADPVGYVMRMVEPVENTCNSAAWVTDLGYPTELVRSKIKDVDILIIESNHDVQLLMDDTKRPWYIKQRILGNQGHLSNETAFQLLSSIDSPRWREVYLAHLSRDCNDIASLRNLFLPMAEKYKFELHVVCD